MDQKIEAVARALCTLDGRNPDQRTRLPGGQVGFRATVSATPDGPALWEAYKAEAEKFVVVAEALAPFVNPPEIKRW